MRKYHDEPYLNLMTRIKKHGVVKEDRTGTGTRSLFAQQMRFDISDGSIPLLTTKKMFTKGIIHELIWFLNGDTNIKYLNDNGVHIWDEWADENGDLNKIYGHQWRKWEDSNWEDHVCEIKIKKDMGNNGDFVPPQNEILGVEDQIGDEFIGKVLQNNDGDFFKVIKKQKLSNKRNSYYTIQFENTTTVSEVSRPNLKRGMCRDPFRKSLCGVACVGIYPKLEEEYYSNAYTLWYNMIKRCYDTSLEAYYAYGGIGVFVDKEWKCFSNFLHDIRGIPNFDKWKQNPSDYNLDKDYFGSNSYNKHACIFIPTKYNLALTNATGSKYIATNKETNKKIEFTIQKWFSEKYQISNGSMWNAIYKSPKNQTREWIIKEIKPKEGFVYRQRMFVDQVAEAVHKLRNNPSDRRIIVSAWNAGQLEEMRLPPCHCLFQFWYDGQDGVSMHLYQRSCDFFLGVPFNIAQYSILLHMFAQVTGLKAKEFVWTGGDVHLYSNHIEQAEEQLMRTPYPSPYLKLNQDVKEIDDFTYKDFEIIDYEYHPTIKAPISV